MNEFPYLKSVPIVRLYAERGAIYRNLIVVNRLLKSHDIIHFQKCHPIVSLPAVCASLIQHKPVHYDWDDNESGILTRLVSEGAASRQQLCGFQLVERRLVRLVDTVSVASLQLKSLALRYGAASDV
ncbi:hypothetical protein J7M28_11450, partial [bacterium]|nr:hypothetical protein [bacterium]